MLDTKERREVFDQDRSAKQGASYADLASLTNPSPGGRFRVGAEIVGHKQQPASVSIWKHDAREPFIDGTSCGNTVDGRDHR
jgi:hypothetical protein